MAKGNDGNYLQHSIEVAAAKRLAGLDCEGRLHLALTHGMAPYEQFEISLWEKKPGLSRRHIKQALVEAAGQRSGKERTLVHAYREICANEKCYPNSLELFKAVIGSEKLYGGITETCPEKHGQLADACRKSKVKVSCTSWRRQLRTGVLSCPDNLSMPWLFSMDPMTYSDKSGDKCSDRLHEDDFDCLSDALKRYVESGRPGIATLFVYSVWKSRQGQFLQFVEQLARCAGMDAYCCWLTHRGGNRNLAGILHTGIASGFDCEVSETERL